MKEGLECSSARAVGEIGLTEELEFHRKGESFGEYLARERRLRNISLEEISQRTRISLRMLKALEESRWEDLPAEVYVKGFLRSYARYIGLDENEVILRYEVHRPPRLKESVKNYVLHRRSQGRKIWLLAILAVLGAGVALLWFLHKRPGSEPASTPGPSVEGVVPAPPGPTMRSQPMPPPPRGGQ